jgi:hypothetical protein
VNKPNTCNELSFAANEAEFNADVGQYERGARSERRQRAVDLRGIAMPRLAVLGHPVCALALAGDAERGAGGAGAGERVALWRRSM